MLDSKIAVLGSLVLLLGVVEARAVTCPPGGALLLEVRREARVTTLHPAPRTVETIQGTFACKNGLGITTRTDSASVLFIAPGLSTARAMAPSLTSALGAALNQAHVGALASCSMPAPELTAEFITLVWHGRGTRSKRFTIAVGALQDLYPPCDAATQSLLDAVRAYSAALPAAPGAEVYTFYYD